MCEYYGLQFDKKTASFKETKTYFLFPPLSPCLGLLQSWLFLPHTKTSVIVVISKKHTNVRKTENNGFQLQFVSKQKSTNSAVMNFAWNKA